MSRKSRISIYAALFGNLAIASIKFLAAFVTDSTAMLSEGIHSVVARTKDRLGSEYPEITRIYFAAEPVTQNNSVKDPDQGEPEDTLHRAVS